MHEITVKDVSFKYTGEENLVLKKMNLKIEEGEFVCLLGQSGCGKSTFLRLLAGLTKPTEGSIEIGDKVVEGAGLDRSVVFQDYSLFPWMTTGKNILLALQKRFPDKPKKELIEQTYYYLNEVGLDKEVYHKYPNELSGGMRQRCAICRALALNSPIMLMDEPYGALDAVTRARLQDMLIDIWGKERQTKKTIIFVTHEVDEALLLASRICVFGLRPSEIIYEHRLDPNRPRDREALFESKEMINLRTTLLQLLNQDTERKLKSKETT